MTDISTPSSGSSAVPLVRSSGGRRELASDLRLTLLFMNEARYRTLERVFGCPKDQANLLTLVVTALLLQGMRDRWQRITRGPVVPPQGDVLLGMGSIRELMLSITGPALRDTPYLGALITAAFVGRAAGPVVIRSIRGVRTGSRRFNTGFRRRYGYLIDLGHRRQRHYEAMVRERAVVR